jgi:hypothetical protein
MKLLVPVLGLGATLLLQIVMFCGAVLLVSLILMTYGLDLSPGFF